METVCQIKFLTSFGCPRHIGVALPRSRGYAVASTLFLHALVSFRTFDLLVLLFVSLLGDYSASSKISMWKISPLALLLQCRLSPRMKMAPVTVFTPAMDFYVWPLGYPWLIEESLDYDPVIDSFVSTLCSFVAVSLNNRSISLF